MTREAIKESLRMAKTEFYELEDSPDQHGFMDRQVALAHFIVKLEKELHEKSL